MSQLLTNYAYIKKENEQDIKNFKYKGGSASLVYGKFWSPFCQYLVEKIPNSIAPNLITMTAFCFVVFTHILMVWYSPDFSQQVPSSLLTLTGFSTLTYQILDNMDGKQARRTNSSTPLGMLFDHGLDSITSWIFGINQLICFGAGASALSAFTILIPCFLGFYTAQWSQYHIGELKLGYINAVDEGLIVVWNLLFLTAVVGVEFWQQEFIYGLSLSTIITIGLVLIGIAEITQFTYSTLSTKTKKSALRKLKTQEISLVLLITTTIVSFFSPSQILNTKYLYFFFISLGFIWSKCTLHLQIAHLGNLENFRQWRKSFMVVCLSFIFNTLSHYIWGACFIDEKLLIVAMAIFSFAIYIHTSTNIVKQMCGFLEIQVFSLKYQKKQQEKLNLENQQNNKVKSN